MSDAREQILEALQNLQRMIDENPDVTAQIVDELRSADSSVKSGWFMLVEFNSPDNLFHARDKLFGSPGIQNHGESCGMFVSATSPSVAVQLIGRREWLETRDHRERCEANMASVAKPVHIPQVYAMTQESPEEEICVEQFLDETCTFASNVKVPRGVVSGVYDHWAKERGYRQFGRIRNQVLSAILTRIAERRGLDIDAWAYTGSTHFITGIVPSGIVPSRMRPPAQWDVPGRGNFLPSIGTVKGTIFEVLTECSPEPMPIREIIVAVKDRHPCAEASIHQGCSNMFREGLIQRGPHGYFVPELQE